MEAKQAEKTKSKWSLRPSKRQTRGSQKSNRIKASVQLKTGNSEQKKDNCFREKCSVYHAVGWTGNSPAWMFVMHFLYGSDLVWLLHQFEYFINIFILLICWISDCFSYFKSKLSLKFWFLKIKILLLKNDYKPTSEWDEAATTQKYKHKCDNKGLWSISGYPLRHIIIIFTLYFSARLHWSLRRWSKRHIWQ